MSLTTIPLRDKIKEYRLRKSRELDIPVYRVFNNKVINTLCVSPPQNKQMLLDIKGIGKDKLERYGQDILDLCRGQEPIMNPTIPPDDTPVNNTSINSPKIETPSVFTKLPIDIQLSDGQESVIQACDTGRNVFISGPGGTGKSLLIHILMERLSIMEKSIQVCALTGAATEVLSCNAITIHSWSGTGISCSDSDKIIHEIMKSKKKVNNWRNIDVLIIDEVSMMSMKYFDTLDAIGRHIRQVDLPFGGIQLIFSGDFYQLPPIPSKGDTSGFCFESNNWKDTFSNEIILKQIFRQSDPQFMKILRQIRRGAISTNTYNILKPRILDTKDILPRNIDMKPPIIAPRTATVDSINNKRIRQLKGSIKTYKMHIYNTQEDISLTPREKGEIKEIKGRMNVEETLILKIGARVMCVVNLEMDGKKQIVNGSQGIVKGFDEGYPIVLFKNGIRRVIKNHTWVGENIKSVGVKQVPLILSWAITIHKSQGITLESAIIDAGDDIFEHGQTYVAFSRVKSLEGLYLYQFNHTKISTNPKVKKYYDSLKISAI